MQIVDKAGKVIVDRKPTCNRVLEEGVADGVNDVLRGVIENPGATGTRMRLAGGRPAAGKTGTTNNSVAVWFAGYTPQLAAAVAVADLDPPQKSLDGRYYNGDRIRQACGGCIPGPIWKAAMDAALKGAASAEFSGLTRASCAGSTRRFPTSEGWTWRRRRIGWRTLDSARMSPVRSPPRSPRVWSSRPIPRRAPRSPRGSYVGLIVSSGQPEQGPPPPEPDDPGRGSRPTIIIPPPPT